MKEPFEQPVGENLEVKWLTLSEGEGAELEKMTEDSAAQHGKLLPDAFDHEERLRRPISHILTKEPSVPLTLPVHRLLDILEIVHRTVETSITQV